MKHIIVFVVGAIVGCVGLHYVQSPEGKAQAKSAVSSAATSVNSAISSVK